MIAGFGNDLLSNAPGAEIDFEKTPTLPGVATYLADQIPECSQQNWTEYGHKVSQVTDEQRWILTDPQINGGLLIAIEPGSAAEFEQAAYENHLKLKAIGQFVARRENVIDVI